MSRKLSRKGQRNKADRLFSQIIRSKGACCICGSTEVVQCAHLISRRYLGTRWDQQNAVPLCQKHHMFYTHRPLEWDLWIEERIGPDAHRELKQRALQLTKPDYESIIAELEQGLRLSGELQDEGWIA